MNKVLVLDFGSQFTQLIARAVRNLGVFCEVEPYSISEKKIREKNLVYLDNAATTLKPLQVVQRISDHYLYETSNVHRGLHYLSDQATENFEHARSKIAHFINANDDEIIL